MEKYGVPSGGGKKKSSTNNESSFTTIKFSYDCPDCIIDKSRLTENPCLACKRVNSPIVVPNIPKQDFSEIKVNYDCCKNCKNHPANGGSGICHCTLPYMNGSGTTY